MLYWGRKTNDLADLSAGWRGLLFKVRFRAVPFRLYRILAPESRGDRIREWFPRIGWEFAAQMGAKKK